MRVNFLTPYRPINDFVGLRRNIDKLFDTFFNLEDTPVRLSTMILRFNLLDKGDTLQLKAEIPGVNKNDIKLSILNDTLSVTGERKAPNVPENSRWIKNERIFGNFSRTFKLPCEIDVTKVGAEYKDGVLNIDLPKSEKAKPKEISINVK